MTPNYELIIDILNGGAFLLFIGLLGAALLRMVVRIITYVVSDRRASIILRRDFALLGAFLVIFGSQLAIRFFGWAPLIQNPGLPRLLYIGSLDIIGVGALGYWTWAEYFVIGQPGKEDN